MSKPKVYYVTKYALTDGIWEVAAKDAFKSEYSAGYLYVGEPGHGPVQVLSKDWHLTLEDALKRFEELRKKRLGSLHRQIETLEAMEPKVIPYKRTR